MKFVTTALLLAPAIAMAAPQQDPTQDPTQDPKVFAQVKARMLPAMSESLPAMEETQACVGASKNSDDLNGCVAIMMSYQQKVMGGARINKTSQRTGAQDTAPTGTEADLEPQAEGEDPGRSQHIDQEYQCGKRVPRIQRHSCRDEQLHPLSPGCRRNQASAAPTAVSESPYMAPAHVSAGAYVR